MNRKNLFSLATIAGAASAQEWTIQSSTTCTMVLGVGVDSNTNIIGAASQNGIGALAESYNGEAWSKERLSAGLIMDAATSQSVSVAVSMWEVLTSTDGGATYVVLDNVRGLSQSCSVFGPGSDLGLVGSFTVEADTKPVYGVAHSPDAGTTWSVSEVPIGWVRYGSFPSQNTWYVTSGMWGDSATLRDGNVNLSSKITARTTGASIDTNNIHGMYNTTEASGWWGAISKTTDGGASWKTVFHSQAEDVYYFNEIACSSETHCVAVAEGDVYYAFVTNDGGETWTEGLTSSGVVPSNMVSLMGASWVNDLEGWVAGTTKNGRVLSGQFYKTVDGGQTYALEQSLDDCFPIDLDFHGTTGAAACLSSSGASGSVALYE